MRKKKLEQGVGLTAAERYAGFFLENPLIAQVYIFGSVALRADGHDVDMVLEVSDAEIGFQFLSELKALSEEFFKDKKPGKIPIDQYENLKSDRHRLAFRILGQEDLASNEGFWDIAWGGKNKEWKDLCDQRQWNSAAQVEENFFRPLDLFLMPPGWKNNETVRELLPNWASDRPWTKRSFLDIMILQSRLYNATTEHFNPRLRRTNKEEGLLRTSMKKEEENRKSRRITQTNSLRRMNP